MPQYVITTMVKQPQFPSLTDHPDGHSYQSTVKVSGQTQRHKRTPTDRVEVVAVPAYRQADVEDTVVEILPRRRHGIVAIRSGKHQVHIIRPGILHSGAVVYVESRRIVFVKTERRFGAISTSIHDSNAFLPGRPSGTSP